MSALDRMLARAHRQSQSILDSLQEEQDSEEIGSAKIKMQGPGNTIRIVRSDGRNVTYHTSTLRGIVYALTAEDAALLAEQGFTRV
jgi:hypothetical protein